MSKSVEELILEFHNKSLDLVRAHSDATEEEIAKLGEPLADEYYRKLLDADDLMRYARLEYMRSLMECVRAETEYVIWYLEHRDRIASDVEPLYADWIEMFEQRGWDLAQIRRLLERLERHIEETEEEMKRLLRKRDAALYKSLFDVQALDLVMKRKKK